MKVALINPPLLGHHHRGTGVYSRLLIQSLNKFTDVKVVETNVNQLPANVDLYHFPYFDPFFLTMPLFRSKKTVLTIHDLIPLKFPSKFPPGLLGDMKWKVQKHLARHVDEIITDSIVSKNDIVNILRINDNKVHSIYLAPDPIFLIERSQVEKERVIKKFILPQRFILFVGDANWNKNLPNCIRAATKGKVPLVVVSNSFSGSKQIEHHPWNHSLLEAKKAALMSSQVLSLGDVDTYELSVIYQLAEILLMPSYYEGFGLPVVEAFASGCPVITSSCGSLSEIAQDAAIVVDPDDTDQISQAISDVWTKKQLATKLTEKGKLQVKKFSWQYTAQETYNVYKKCIET